MKFKPNPNLETGLVSLGLPDLLPNGLFNNLPHFFAGALYGLSKTLSRGKQGLRNRRLGETSVPLEDGHETAVEGRAMPVFVPERPARA